MAAPSAIAVHGALATGQLLFGGGSIIGKFGVHGTNPVFFAFLREAVAGPLLWVIAMSMTRKALPPAADVPRLCSAGFGLFANQLFFLTGLKLSDPLSGSAWQPAQPILTLALAIIVGYERPSWRRASGIILAVAGAVCMVLLGSAGHRGGSGPTPLLGHALFFFNCLGTSWYVIVSKALVARHAPILVTSWSYLFASCMMFATVVVANNSPALLRLVCHDEDPRTQHMCEDNAWSVPASALLPLFYWIVCSSMISYGLMTWANRYAKASVVSAYTVLQPATSGLLSTLLILAKGTAWGDKYGLLRPGIQDVGLVGIALGLLLAFSEPTGEAAPTKGAASPTSSTLPCGAESACEAESAEPGTQGVRR